MSHSGPAIEVHDLRKHYGSFEAVRGIEISLVLVGEHATDQAALRELSRQAAAGELTLRVAETFPPERAGEAHAKLEAGGVRGHLVIAF